MEGFQYTLSPFPKDTPLAFKSTSALEGGNYIAVDLNGDCKADMYCVLPWGVHVAMSLGDGTLSLMTRWSKYGYAGLSPYPRKTRLVLEDISGDGKADAICLDSSWSVSMWMFKGLGEGVFSTKKLFKHTDSNGNSSAHLRASASQIAEWSSMMWTAMD